MPTGLTIGQCTLTGWLNDYDQTFVYTVPNDRVLVGWESQHSNFHEYDDINKEIDIIIKYYIQKN